MFILIRTLAMLALLSIYILSSKQPNMFFTGIASIAFLIMIYSYQKSLEGMMVGVCVMLISLGFLSF